MKITPRATRRSSRPRGFSFSRTCIRILLGSKTGQSRVAVPDCNRMAHARTFCDTSAVFSRVRPADACDPWCRIHIQRENKMHVPLTVRKLLLGFVVVLLI